MTLSSLGWDDFFANHFPGSSPALLVPARVAFEHKHTYGLLSPEGEFAAQCTGRLLHSARTRANLPAVGDWVAASLRPGESRADIHAVLPRKTKFSRLAAGGTATEQVVAANIDTVFLVTALDHNYNLRRIERYLAVARESGAKPVVVLNKADLHPDPPAAEAEVAAIAAGTPVVAVSATSLVQNLVPAGTRFCTAMEALAPWLGFGRTVALLGSSGVGKSTLINCLLGAERQATGDVSIAHGKGRHTTTHRELVVAPSGALLMDTPGMRELQLWDVASDTLEDVFAEIARLAVGCRFGDCAHASEPGCAVQAALRDGSLDPSRWQGFQKLQRERARAARQSDPRLAREQRNEWRKINRAARQHFRLKREG